MDKSKILFTEDDEQYGLMVKEILENEGYYVDYFASSLDALDALANTRYDVIISDYKMQSVDGLKLLKLAKKIAPGTRTMILTASPTAESEVEALELQIDSYLLKETRIDILLQSVERLASLAEKIEHGPNEVLVSTSENLVLTPLTREVTKDGKQVKLTTKQFAILQYFLERKEQAVSREDIIETLWDQKFEEVDPRIVDGHIKELRRRLKIQSIVSIRGYGYKWNEE